MHNMGGGTRTNDDTVIRHMLASNLQPTTGRSAKIDAASRGFEEVVLLVELNELEGRSSAVALLPVVLSGSTTYGRTPEHALCKLVVLVETTLSCLLLSFTHFCVEEWVSLLSN